MPFWNKKAVSCRRMSVTRGSTVFCSQKTNGDMTRHVRKEDFVFKTGINSLLYILKTAVSMQIPKLNT